MKFISLSVLFFVPFILSSAIPEAAPATLEKRADKVCKVAADATPCYRLPGIGRAGSGQQKLRDIITSDRFGVNCRVTASAFNGDTTWDWIPGWGCWVSSYYTRTADSTPTCETNVLLC
ncbi:hypothetical protein BJ508DRAFT_156936 [Ascobolus immersus RN42]|uniref:Uncharacterized protein n=1 Tax=Ascobolus immersus RN42 TaxID=1160509 RepID=A0A3N4HYU8_ASCIM|nr:hypothetical protein BJ508DRAFT_156936 [Ascobolus immersus RN42]